MRPGAKVDLRRAAGTSAEVWSERLGRPEGVERLGAARRGGRQRGAPEVWTERLDMHSMHSYCVNSYKATGGSVLV